MIVTCPHCKTSHSKPAAGVAAGVSITCRGCGESFRPSAPEPDAIAAPDRPALEAEDTSPQAAAIGDDPSDATVASAPPADDERTGVAPRIERAPAADADDGGFRVSTQIGLAAPKRARFPREELRRWLDAQWRELESRSWQLKVVLGAIAAAPGVVLLTFIFVLWLGPDPQRWTTGHQVLMSLPPSASGGVEVAALLRGSELYAYEQVGDWVLVRDVKGRAGYVAAAGIDAEPPPSVPEHAFADCEAGLAEDDTPEPCQHRGQLRFDSCRAVCAERDDDAEQSCLEHCQSRLADCLRTCEGRTPPPEPAPVLEEPVAAVQPEPEQVVEEAKRAAAPKKPAAKPKKKRGRK